MRLPKGFYSPFSSFLHFRESAWRQFPGCRAHRRRRLKRAAQSNGIIWTLSCVDWICVNWIWIHIQFTALDAHHTSINIDERESGWKSRSSINVPRLEKNLKMDFSLSSSPYLFASRSRAQRRQKAKKNRKKNWRKGRILEILLLFHLLASHREPILIKHKKVNPTRRKRWWEDEVE